MKEINTVIFRASVCGLFGAIAFAMNAPTIASKIDSNVVGGTTSSVSGCGKSPACPMGCSNAHFVQCESNNSDENVCVNAGHSACGSDIDCSGFQTGGYSELCSN